MDSAMQEAVAYLHTLHMEAEQTTNRLSQSERNPFGIPGRDYSEEYTVTTVALYPATALAEREADRAEIARLRNLLRDILDQSRVGSGNLPVSRSKRVNYPASLYFAGCATLSDSQQ